MTNINQLQFSQPGVAHDKAAKAQLYTIQHDGRWHFVFDTGARTHTIPVDSLISVGTKEPSFFFRGYKFHLKFMNGASVTFQVIGRKWKERGPEVLAVLP